MSVLSVASLFVVAPAAESDSGKLEVVEASSDGAEFGSAESSLVSVDVVSVSWDEADAEICDVVGSPESEGGEATGEVTEAAEVDAVEGEEQEVTEVEDPTPEADD